MNCLIVDDNEISVLEIKALINKVPFLKQIDMCSSAKDALPVLLFGNIDLLFLDVSMPEMTGFELMNHLNGNKPLVILITQDKDYAIKGFDYGITDFILKPVSEYRFLQAVSKAKAIYDNIHSDFSKAKSLFVKTKASFHQKIELQDIFYIKADNNYVTIFTEKEQFLVFTSMQTILDKLPADEFIRTHRSYIVRLDKVKKIEDYYLNLDTQKIPVSKPLLNVVKSRLNIV